MKIILKPHQILGDIVKIVATKSGIILAEGSKQKKETILFLIREIGTDVKGYKVGDIVCPASVNNLVLRDQDFHVIEESTIFCAIGDLPLDQIEIAGKPGKTVSAANGGGESSVQP